MVNMGDFDVSRQINYMNYTQLTEDRDFTVETDDVELDGFDEIQKIFFIYSELDFEKLEGFEGNSLEFFIFNKHEGIVSVEEMREHLFITVFRFWMPYLIVASGCYLVICGLIIKYIAKNMTKPFLELSRRIRLNVKNI